MEGTTGANGAVNPTAASADAIREPALGDSLPEMPAILAVDELLQIAARVQSVRARFDAFLAMVAALVADHTALALEDGSRALKDPARHVEIAAEELAMVLGVTRRAAERQIAVGRTVNGVLMDTGAAMHDGRIGFDKAWVLTEMLGEVAPEVAMAVEEAVLPRAPERTSTELRRDVARALVEMDPDGADSRHEVARSRRHVGRPRVEPHGMASMRLVLTAQGALALDAALDAVADAAARAHDPRTHGQLRADALTEWSRAVLAEGWLPGICDCANGAACATCESAGLSTDLTTDDSVSARGVAATPTSEDALDGGEQLPAVRVGPVPAAVRVTVPLEVLAHALDGWVCHESVAGLIARDIHGQPPAAGSGTSECEHSPVPSAQAGRTEAAWLVGYGPIAPATARLLAAGGTWQRIITDTASGLPLDVGRERYSPPAHIAEAVRNRDRTCQRPGCSTPPSRCEIDHVTEWQHGGRTSLHNLALLCSRCHRIKSLGGGVESHLQPDGSRTWTSLSGYTHGRLTTREYVCLELPHIVAAHLVNQLATTELVTVIHPAGQSVVDTIPVTRNLGHVIDYAGGTPGTDRTHLTVIDPQWGRANHLVDMLLAYTTAPRPAPAARPVPAIAA